MGCNVKQSTERILTTHTGSLPRPEPLVAMLKDKEAGTLRDQAAFDKAVKIAVKDIVKKQLDVGVDLVNDGEMSKVGYSTYVTDRVTGFESKTASDMLRVADVA